jgi:hypothetical protein
MQDAGLLGRMPRSRSRGLEGVPSYSVPSAARGGAGGGRHSPQGSPVRQRAPAMVHGTRRIGDCFLELDALPRKKFTRLSYPVPLYHIISVLVFYYVQADDSVDPSTLH